MDLGPIVSYTHKHEMFKRITVGFIFVINCNAEFCDLIFHARHKAVLAKCVGKTHKQNTFPSLAYAHFHLVSVSAVLYACARSLFVPYPPIASDALCAKIMPVGYNEFPTF